MDSLTQMALGATCGEKDDDLLFVNIYPRNLSLMKGIKEHLPMVKNESPIILINCMNLNQCNCQHTKSPN